MPDLLFVAASRAAIFQPKSCDGPPDLALEIVCPESTARDWRVKFGEYEALGIREYWIVDPQAKGVEAYELDDAETYQLLPNHDGSIHSFVLPGWWLRPE